MTYGKAHGGAIRRDRQAKARCNERFAFSQLDVQCLGGKDHDGDCFGTAGGTGVYTWTAALPGEQSLGAI